MAEPNDELTERVLVAVFEVANTLKASFLEKVYHQALLRELKLKGIPAKTEAPFPVFYKGQKIGEYFADILVHDKLLVEIKCADRLTNDHMAQCLNYLRASNTAVCLLINFQKPTVEWKRIVLNYEPSATADIAQ